MGLFCSIQKMFPFIYLFLQYKILLVLPFNLHCVLRYPDKLPCITCTCESDAAKHFNGCLMELQRKKEKWNSNQGRIVFTNPVGLCHCLILLVLLWFVVFCLFVDLLCFLSTCFPTPFCLVSKCLPIKTSICNDSFCYSL